MVKDYGEIRVAIIGVGNCASSLVQGVELYKKLKNENSDKINNFGIVNNKIGRYGIEDIVFSCAFDVNRNKIGKDLSEAIFIEPNNALKFNDNLENLDCKVYKGNVLDGIGKFVRDKIWIDPREPDDFRKVLKDTGTDIVLNYLPVGSEEATKWYTEGILNSGCGMVNCIPVFIASNPGWSKRFEEKGLPIIGDDVKSQVGATIIHRVLADLFEKRGVKIKEMYQVNFGGNMDFLNMLERERLSSKKISKTEAVSSQLKNFSQDKIHIGPSDYIGFLNDRKICHISIEATGFGGVKTYLDLKLNVEDSPNSAGVVIDAIRCCKLALENKISGALIGPSSYYMKHPPIKNPSVQMTDAEAYEETRKFIEMYSKY